MNSVTTLTSIETDMIRKEFPILNQRINGHPLVYFDNAATTQKPQRVIDALALYYQHSNSNIHRGVHALAERATRDFELTRETVRDFLNASSMEEIIFVRGVTEAINLVAFSYGEAFISEGDEILISAMEHHANIVPWQLLCERKKARLLAIPVSQEGELMVDEMDKLLSPQTRIVAINHVSNSLGTINPVKEIVRKAHEHGAVVLLDGAQAGGHLQIDVRDLDCDFYCLSAHKMYGPTGVGVLYGKKDLLEKMPPFHGGGEMIREVTFERTTYNDLPYKFEAGTPDIGGVVAFRHALGFIDEHRGDVFTLERHLLEYATRELSGLPGVRIVGTAKEKVAVLSFVIDGLHPYDIGQMLDARGIAVRTGHHCTQPLMRSMGVDGTTRASLAFYNTKDEVDHFISSLVRAMKFLR